VSEKPAATARTRLARHRPEKSAVQKQTTLHDANMQRLSRLLLGFFGLHLIAACPSTNKVAELTGAPPPAETSTSNGDSTGGDLCAPGDLEILGQCYHKTTVTDIHRATSVVAADFTGDQALELVTVCRGANTSLGICFYDLGSTVIKTDIDWLSVQAQVHAGDFNADGISDVLVSGLSRFAVYSLDLSLGAFVEQSGLEFDSSIHDYEDFDMSPALTIDLDMDGRAEIVTGSRFNGIRLWRFDQSSSAWEPSGARQTLFGCGDLADAAVADLDGDDRPELLALGSHDHCDTHVAPGAGWNRVSVFAKSPGALELFPTESFAAGLPARHLEIADINNGDAAPDLFVTSVEDIMMFGGHGDGTFAMPVYIPGLVKFVGKRPHAGDFNGDGIDELLAGSVAGYQVLVGLPEPQILEISVGGVELVADLNQDGHADIVSKSTDGDLSLVTYLSVP